MPKGWIQEVEKEMEKDGTEGSFSAKAKRAGKSTHAYAMEVVKKYKGKDGNTKAQEHLLKQAVLALNFEKMRKGKDKKKDTKPATNPASSAKSKPRQKYGGNKGDESRSRRDYVKK